MIKCLVVDDEPLARALIERYISQLPALQLLHSCANAVEAFHFMESRPVDLLFLDIRMPLVNGIEFFKKLPVRPPVIFTTAYSEYAVDSYDLEAVDYLLKPVTFPRFKKSIEKFMKQSGEQVSAVTDYLFIKHDGRLIRIYHHEILYAESRRDYLKIVTGSRQYITHLTMKALVALLPASMFIRVHRSYIVNLNHIQVVGKNEVELNGVKIPVGENYRTGTRDLK